MNRSLFERVFEARERYLVASAMHRMMPRVRYTRMRRPQVPIRIRAYLDDRIFYPREFL